MNRGTFVACAAWALLAATLVPRHAAADAAQAAAAASPLPPLEDFFRRPAYSRVSLSPDGKLMIAFVPLNDHRNLALIDIEKHTAVALTTFSDQDVSDYAWLGDRMLEIKTGNLADASGLVRTRQDLVIDTAGNLVRNMAAVSKRGYTEIIRSLDRAGDDLIIQSIDRNLYSPDAYRYNPRTGEKKLLTFQSPGDVVRYIADHQGQVRVAISQRKGASRTVLSYRRSNDDAWTTLRDEAVESATIDPIAFDDDGRTLYVYARNPDNGGRNDVHAFDPDRNELGKRIFAAKDVDAGAIVYDGVGHVPIGIVDGSRGGVDWIDPEWARLQKSVDAALPDTQNHLAPARDDPSRVIVVSHSATQPPIFYLLDHATLKMEEVAIAYPWLKPGSVSPRRFVRYRARDGLSIPAFLTMPDKPDGAKPPLIVHIHGGPFVDAEGDRYDAEAAFFASRGYAVLQPDFRGTIGYGDKFEQAGWKQWGLAMQDDITDGVRWLVDNGKVDGDRVCLFGASYGGYATLWGLENEPSLYRCGIAEVAVSDLELLFDVTWSDTARADRDGSMTNFFKRTLGDPDKDRAKLREVSPLYHADRIRAPLLLAYGGSDVRVPLIHASRMRSALEKFDKPYEYVVYDDEGHGFNKDANRYDFYRRVEAFLKKNLAPRPSSTAAVQAAPATAQ